MGRDSLVLRAIAVAIGAIAWQQALPNPTGPNIVTGVSPGGITGLGTSTVNLTTNAAKSIMEWQGFSIGSGELTRFTQPSASAAVLNRVTSTSPSSILGSLQSNGRVFLINPNGITFGAGSTVDVAGLVASSLNLTNDNFLVGTMSFSGGGAGAVVNNGSITTTGAGAPVYLIGPSVTNGGAITSPRGEVVLAAGSSVAVVNPGTPEVTVEITAPTNQALNAGSIVADSGRINVFAGLINQNGLMSASTAVAGADGTVLLKTDTSGTTMGDINFGSASRTEGTFVRFDAAGNIGLNSAAAGQGAVVKGTTQVIADTLTRGKTITEGANASIQGGFLGVTANGTISLPDANSMQSFGGFEGTGSSVLFNNTSPLLLTTFQLGGPANPPSSGGGTFTLHQAGNLRIVFDSFSGAQNISATGNVFVGADGGPGIRVTAFGPQTVHAGGNLTLQGGSANGGLALLSATGPQTISAGNNITLNGGTGLNASAAFTSASSQTITTGGNLHLLGGSGSGAHASITNTGTGLQRLSAGGSITLQGGSGSDAYALIRSADSIDATIGGSLVLNEGTGRGAWARIQTESRDSTITLHFPNLSSGGWSVNGAEGAVRRGQSGFLSGNGAAVRRRTLIVDYGP